MKIKSKLFMLKLGLLTTLYLPLSGCSLFSGDDKKVDEAVEAEEDGNGEEKAADATASSEDKAAEPVAASEQAVAPTPPTEVKEEPKVEAERKVEVNPAPVELAVEKQSAPAKAPGAMKSKAAKVVAETTVHETADGNELSYVITKGDSLSKIAKKFSEIQKNGKR